MVRALENAVYIAQANSAGPARVRSPVSSVRTASLVASLAYGKVGVVATTSI